MIADFLSDRFKKKVVVNKYMSGWLNCISGVLQGNILGLL